MSKKHRLVTMRELARIVEDMLVCSVADAGHAADDAIPNALHALGRFYGQNPRDIAQRVALKAELDERAAPGVSAYRARAAVFAAAGGAS